MSRHKNIMISSTTRDLPEYRKEVKEACLQQGMFPIMMEHLPASDADAITESLRMVDEADLYVLVIGYRYGTVPAGHLTSITEMEYNQAVKKKIPILVFVMHQDHPVDPTLIGSDDDRTKLEAFKTRVPTDRVVSYYKSPADLRAQVINSLSHTLRLLRSSYSRRAFLFGIGVTGFALGSAGIYWIETHEQAPTRPVRPIGTLIFEYQGHTASVNGVAWSHSGRRIASAGSDEAVRVWDAITGSHPFTYHGHSFDIFCAEWSPDDTHIASAGVDLTTQVWNVTNGFHPLIYRGHSGPLTELSWSPDGLRIASSSADGTAQTWDANTGKKLLTYSRHVSAVESVAWSPLGEHIASGGDDKTVQIWDANTGGRLFTYSYKDSSVMLSIAWKHDGTRLAAGNGDGTVSVWDAPGGNFSYTYHGHADVVYRVAWSPDGKRIASASADKTVQVWDATGGDASYTYHGHTDVVYGVAWSPDGKYIASAGADKTVQVWVAK